MQFKLLVLLLYLLSNSKNETAAKGVNQKVVTKYIYHTKDNDIDQTFKRNISKRNVDEKNSQLVVIFYFK